MAKSSKKVRVHFIEANPETIFVRQMGGYICRVLCTRYPEIKSVNIKITRPDSSGFGFVIYSDKPLTGKRQEKIRNIVFEKFFKFEVLK